jgi:hypothetical protein
MERRVLALSAGQAVLAEPLPQQGFYVVVVQHHCIYCDSRSECHQIEDFDGEVLVKANALALLRKELPRKRVKTLSWGMQRMLE